MRADSAGVEVVLNLVTVSAAPVFATVDPRPVLRLGTIDGRKEEQFGTVTDAVALPDGGIAILDGLAAEIRLFGPDGTYRSTIGSKGQGPGELQRPIELALLGDTLALYDRQHRRITRFGLDGTLGRVTSLKDTRSTLVAASFLPDGRFIGQSRWLAPNGGQIPGPELTLVRDTAVLTLFTSDGTVADTVDVVAGAETLTSVKMSDGSISVFRRPPVFGRTNVFTVHPDGVWSSANDRFELRLYDVGTGNLVRIVRAPGLEQPITDALAQSIHDRAAANAETPEDRRRMEEWYGLSRRPASQPAYDLMVVDRDARVWVRAWSILGPATRWWVIARDGNFLGSVDMPTEMKITSVRCGSVWGIELDELDVSYVTRYALRGMNDCR